MNPLLHLYTHIPNWRGKAYLGEKLFRLTKTSGLFTQKTQHGFSMELDLSDRLQRLIFIKRAYETETSSALLPFLKTARGFMDIGANVGYFSLLAKSANPKCHVVAIEPLPLNTEKLLRNKNLNNFESLDIVDVCISDEPGTTSFLIPPNNERGWGRIAYKTMFDGHLIQRTVETIDRIVPKLGVSNVDVIKMDIEGFEFKALQGMVQTLKTHRPVLCIELNEPCLIDLGTSGDDVLAWLKAQNYKTHYIKYSGDLVATDKTIENYEFFNYIALPL